MEIGAYLNEIRDLAESGQATEHSYRPALERLFKSIDTNLTVINEPKRLTDVGAPDFVFNRKGVPIGWCEAKDLGKEITKFKAGDYSKEQKVRYAKGLPNLIYTNGVDFEFIRTGDVVDLVTIAEPAENLLARPDQFERLEMLLRDFAQQTPISINTAKQLAEMMAGKAMLIKDRIGNSLLADTKAGENSDLVGQFQAFKTHLIHDITIADFADIYAETIAYGLFAARLHDESLDNFNRAEALDLLPKSNPFLRSLFVYIAGPNLDDRLIGTIDDLCQIFRACDVRELMQDFGKWTARNDPFLHFYETFLAEYNPAKRRARGVWYTPEPVVNFIVRAVDDVLKTEFGLPMGLADTSKVTIDWDTGQKDKKGNPQTIKKDVHRVQILDPATGTGTFLAEAIKQIAAQVKDVAPAMWSNYVEKDLIPRLHGFELLMASYAMCHMKLDMMLTDMGYRRSANPPRLNVFLTNSLEEGEKVEQTLFGLARDITEEGRKASEIKNDMPIMCVIGNPPYSGESANKGEWIMGLMEAYKKEPGGKQKLQERNPKWINDDYVKFIRFAEHMIVKNGEGILGFITNHGYLDNPTFRGIRWHLLKTFDKIYVLDLHGSTKKKERAPDGSIDQNVFDITPGVAIIIGVKKAESVNEPKPLASVKYAEIWGNRLSKNDALWSAVISEFSAPELSVREPQFPFVNRDYELENTYSQGFSVAEMMPINGVGMVTARDGFVIGEKQELLSKFSAFQKCERNEMVLHTKFDVPRKLGWSILDAHDALQGERDLTKFIQPITYRPFDQRHIFYEDNAVWRTVRKVMHHARVFGNVALAFNRTVEEKRPYTDAFVFSGMIQHHSLSLKEVNYLAPLYLYPEEGTLETGRRVNFDPKIYAEIRKRAGLSGVDGDELRVFDYIYGVLHSPDYRRTYAQFLKIDFPRIPYPASPDVFAHVSELGGQLRRLHLMEDAAIGDTPYLFNGEGDNVVVKPALSDDGRVFINPDQWFEGVPAIAWEFHIGGYQPAQKWLKDRRGRALSFDDVRHYQKIIKILVETDRIMQLIKLPL
jgi:hypothetical protein